MKTNRTAIDIIQRWEGLRLEAYKCPAGIPTIGFGHTSAAGEPKVFMGMKITRQEAADILVKDLVKYEAAVTRALTRVPNENQFSAMVSLCYNIGPGAFAGSSIAKRFNQGDVEGAAEAFLLWNKAGGQVLKGLVNRRADERKLFLTPVAKPAPLPPPPDVEPAHIPPEKPAQPAPESGSGKALAWVVAAVITVLAALAAIFMKG